MTYSRRTWANGNQWDQVAANDLEGRIEAEFGVKATEIAAKASTTYVDSADAALDARLDIVEANLVTSGSSSLPGSPVDGQVAHYIADSTNGVVWQFRYRSGSASSFKWEFIGGGALYSEVLTQETGSSTTYVDVATTGPSVTLPLAGDYEIAFGSDGWSNTANFGFFVSPKLGAAATSDNDGASHVSATIGANTSVWRSIKRTGLAASAVIKLQYRAAGGGGFTVLRRNLAITPVRVG